MLSVHEKQGQPLYLQIYQQLKEDIRTGKMPAGSRLPSKRKMAAQLEVSVNTVEGAYGQLLSEGFIRSAPQRGYFVCDIGELISLPALPADERPQQASTPQADIDFSTSHISQEKFPYNLWRKLLKNSFNEYDPHLLDCPPAQGNPGLREEIARYLYQARGVHCTADHVIIGAGTDHLMQMVSYLLPNGCTLAMENPVYHTSSEFFRRMGHQVRFIDVDEDGVPPQALEGMNDTALYITPSHQFPLGTSMPIRRRIQLLNWANEGQGRYLIEDDYDSEFRYGCRPISSLQSIDHSGRVIYLGTFSKAVAPSLRISYMVLPPQLLDRYHQQYENFSSAVSGLEQLVLAEFLRSGAFETHLNRMRNLYRGKRELLISLLEPWGDAIAIRGENAGHHIPLHLHGGMTEEEMCRRALEQRVKVYPISRYFRGEVPTSCQSTVLLGYAGLTEKQILQGVQRLHRAWLE